MTYQEITVGELPENNSDVLKELYWITPEPTSLQDMINEVPKIKRPRFSA